jgi:hypothetical protein
LKKDHCAFYVLDSNIVGDYSHIAIVH